MMDPAIPAVVLTVVLGAGLLTAAARLRGVFENVHTVVGLAGFGFFAAAVVVMGVLPFLHHREDTTVPDVCADRAAITDFVERFAASSPGNADRRVVVEDLLDTAKRLARRGLGRVVDGRVILRSNGPELLIAEHRRGINRLNQAAYDYLLTAHDKDRLLRDASGDRAKAQKQIDDTLNTVREKGASRDQIETALRNIEALKPRTDADRRARADLPALRRLAERFAELDTNRDGRLLDREGVPEADRPPAVPPDDLAAFHELMTRIPGTRIRRTRVSDFQWRVVREGRSYNLEQAGGRYTGDRPPDARLGLAAVDSNLDGALTADEILALAERRRFDGRVLLAELMRWDFETDGRLTEIEIVDALNSFKADRESTFLSDDDFAALATRTTAELKAAIARHAPRRMQDLAGKGGLSGLPATEMVLDGAAVRVTNLLKIAANGATLPGVLDALSKFPPAAPAVELTGLDKVHASLYRQLKAFDYDGNDVLDDADAVRLEADMRRRADAVFTLTGYSEVREITTEHIMAAFHELDRNLDGVVNADDHRSAVPPYSFAAARGRQVYIREGCMYCHTQYIRPVCGEEQRWGPVSRRAEYLHDQPHLLGTRRIGPDLSRVGGKYADGWHWAHHLRPRNVAPESVMPSFHWLYQPETDPEYLRRSERVRRFIAAYDTESRLSGAPEGDGGEIRPERDGIITTRLVDGLTGETLDDVGASFARVWEPYRTGEKSLPSRHEGTDWVFDVSEPAAALLLELKEVRVAAPGEAAARAQVESRLRKAVDDLFGELDLNGDGVIDGCDGRRRPTRELLDLTAYLQRLGTAISIEDWRGEYFNTAAGAGGVIADTPDNRAVGRLIYERHCIGCHGARGDGQGVAAAFLDGIDVDPNRPAGTVRPARQPPPRNFRPGRFKFRSTPDGSPPTDDDLLRTVSRGLRGTAMPGFHELSERDRRLVVNYIKTFSDRYSAPVAGRADGSGNVGRGGIRGLNLGPVVFHGEEFTATYLGDDRWSVVGRLEGAVRHTAVGRTGRPIEVPETGMTFTVFGNGFNAGDAFRFTTYSMFHDPRKKPVPRPDVLEARAPPASYDLLARGRQIFHGSQAGCAKCHGNAGRGDGPARLTEPMFTESGFKTAPADLADIYGIRAGATAEDLYRTLTTGVSGTPMAQFAGSLPNEYDRWAVVHYVRYLRHQGLAERYWRSLIPPGTPADKVREFDKFKRPRLFGE